VLQLAELHHLPTGGDGNGSLSVDRNAPFTVEFAPPRLRALTTSAWRHHQCGTSLKATRA